VIWSSIYTAAGLLVLIFGGYLVVAGASALAHRLGVSNLVVGLTVVAFGTSAPELAVNLSAAFSGDSGIAFGNVIGSNIANVGLILGLAAAVRALDIQSELLSRELPMMLLATAAAVAMALDPRLSGRPAEYDRVDGLLLLLLFAVFLYGIARAIYRRREADSLLVASSSAAPTVPRPTLAYSAAMVALGLGALVAGGHFAVKGAVALSVNAGVSTVVIGATVVAVGTSLPELVTSLVAAVRKEHDIAVGNIVGSNIFNLLFILGMTAAIRPLPLPDSGYRDLVALVVCSLVLWVFALTSDRRIMRWEGLILLLTWAGYVFWRYAAGP
jgi:cation:H+ antiporter